MKILPEKMYHELFRWGVMAKLLLSAGEIAVGAALSFVNYEAIKGFALIFIGGEVAETPRDLIWDYAARSFHSFAAAPESFWAFLFISHGVVKAFLAWGLWREKLWSFPISGVIFTGFVIYQVYQSTYVHSGLLWLITVFDIALIILILHEWKHRRRRLAARG